jgi:hypothetical protein
MSTVNSASTETPGYDRLIQVAAGSITAAASALGVLGVGAGVALSLLRNAPEATLTGVSLAGTAVLAGMGSALTRSEAVLASRRRLSAALVAASCLFVSWTWLLVGWAYTTVAARSNFERAAWWGFVTTWIVATAGLGYVGWRSRYTLQMRTALVIGALVAFGSAVLALAVLAATASRASGNPVIAVKTDPLDQPPGALALTATVTAEGLSTHEQSQIVVTLADNPDGSGNRNVLFQTAVAPSSDGTVDYTFTIAAPGGAEDQWLVASAISRGPRVDSEDASAACERVETGESPPFGTACVIVRVPAEQVIGP